MGNDPSIVKYQCGLNSKQLRNIYVNFIVAERDCKQHETQNVEGNAIITHAACKRICLTTLKKYQLL